MTRQTVRNYEIYTVLYLVRVCFFYYYFYQTEIKTFFFQPTYRGRACQGPPVTCLLTTTKQQNIALINRIENEMNREYHEDQTDPQTDRNKPAG